MNLTRVVNIAIALFACFQTTVLCFNSFIGEFFKFKQIGLLNNVFCRESEALLFLESPSATRLMTSNKFGARKGIVYEVDFAALNKNRLGVSIDLDCPSSQDLIKKLSADFNFNNTYVYLLRTRHFQKAVELLEGVNLAWDSDVTLRSGPSMYDIYKNHNTLPLKVSLLGNWSELGTSSLEPSSRPSRRDMAGTPIKGYMVLLNLTLSKVELHEKMLDYSFEPEKDLLSRTGYSLMNIIREMFNFTFNRINRLDVTITDDFGYYNETIKRFGPGSMFGALQNNVVEFSVSLSNYLRPRMLISNLGPQASRFRTCFIFKHPLLLADHASLARPFSNELWCLVIAFILTFGLGFRVVRQVQVEDKPPNEASLLDSMVLMVGIMAQQGLATSSRRIPTRILSIFAILASLVIYILYGATIVRFLLSSTPRTLNTVDKLLQSSLQLYAEDVKYQRSMFLSNLSTDATKTYYRAIKSDEGDQDKFIGLEEGLKRVREGKFALYASDTNMYAVVEKTFTESDKCELAEVTTFLSGVCHATRKLSPYKELLFLGTARSKECGLQAREASHWYSPKPTCRGLNSVAVSFQATLIAQLAMFGGVCLSLVTLCVEINVSRLVEVRRRRQRRRRWLE